MDSIKKIINTDINTRSQSTQMPSENINNSKILESTVGTKNQETNHQSLKIPMKPESVLIISLVGLHTILK